MFLRLFVLFCLTIVFCVDQGSSQSMVCPEVRTTSGWLDLFPLPCGKNAECRVMGTQHLCCKGFCTKGVKAAPLRDDGKRSVSDSTTNSITSPSSSTSTSSSTSSSSSTSTSSSSSTSTSSSTSSSSSTTTTSTSTTTTPVTTSSTTTTSTTTTTKKPVTNVASPLQPFFTLLPIQSTKPTSAQSKSKTSSKSTQTGKGVKLVCPKPGQVPFILFAVPCEKSSQCRISSGPEFVCCEGRCLRGVPAPKPTPPPKPHQPLLGVIPRECPAEPLGELLFEVQTCKSDEDCWPRICCPDGTTSYCRTARARLDLVPVANQIDGPVRMLEQYLQCTAPPKYDLFPRTCSSSVDCFPNLCCAEGGKKHCRPAKRSIIGLLAGATQRVGSTIGNIRQAQAQAERNRL